MSFISNYLKMVENTEPPLIYHQWSCLSALSVMAGRRFWFMLGPITYHTNLYVVLVGHPGVKKSSAMDRAKDIVRQVKCCPIAAAQVTKEFIAKTMSGEKFPGKRYYRVGDLNVEYNQYAIFATELTQFLAVNPLGMIDFLTTIYTEKVYDCDTKGQGSDYIVGPYITMLACMTPEIVKGFLKMNILTGGFSRRTIFCYGTGGNIIPIPSFTDEQRAAMEYCIAFGKKLQDRSGEFKMSAEAEAWYIKWYNDLHRNMSDIAKPTTEGYYRTKHELLFKIGMLIMLSEGGLTDPLILEVEHFKLAERFFAPVEKNLERVFEGSGINPNASAAAQICRMLESINIPMRRKELEGMFGEQATSYNELRDLLAHLISVGRLVQRDVYINNALTVQAIGTSAVMANYTDVQLVAFLQRKRTPSP